MEDKIPTLEEKYLKDIIEEKFEIPIYQRPYKWRKEHVIQLLDDLYENIYLKNAFYISVCDSWKQMNEIVEAWNNDHEKQGRLMSWDELTEVIK